MSAIHAPSKPFTNLKKLGATTSEALTHGEAEGWETLATNPNLESLTVHNLTEDKAVLLGKLRNLRKLEIKNCSAGNLSHLAGLGQLCHLKIATAVKPKDFSFLGRLTSLNCLELSDVTKFRDVGILKTLRALRTFEFTRVFSRIKLPDLNCFARLRQLKTLNVGVDVASGSLSPLIELSQLEELHLPLIFDLEEYAKLAIALPQTQCRWFAKPYVAGVSWKECKRCGGTKIIYLAKGWRSLCPKCDVAKFEGYMKTFEQMKANFRKSLAAD